MPKTSLNTPTKSSRTNPLFEAMTVKRAVTKGYVSAEAGASLPAHMHVTYDHSGRGVIYWGDRAGALKALKDRL